MKIALFGFYYCFIDSWHLSTKDWKLTEDSSAQHSYLALTFNKVHPTQVQRDLSPLIAPAKTSVAAVCCDSQSDLIYPPPGANLQLFNWQKHPTP